MAKEGGRAKTRCKRATCTTSLVSTASIKSNIIRWNIWTIGDETQLIFSATLDIPTSISCGTCWLVLNKTLQNSLPARSSVWRALPSPPRCLIPHKRRTHVQDLLHKDGWYRATVILYTRSKTYFFHIKKFGLFFPPACTLVSKFRPVHTIPS